MNPTLTVWLQLMGLLAVEVAVIVGIATQLQRLTKSAIWRRTIWHSCILSLLLLVVFEFTGAARGMVVWIGKKPASATTFPSGIANANTTTPARQANPPVQVQVELQPASAPHATTPVQSSVGARNTHHHF